MQKFKSCPPLSMKPEQSRKERQNGYRKIYRIKHRELVKERYQKWVAENPDKLRQSQAEYRKRNREKLLAKNRAYNEANKEQRRERSQQYREAGRHRLILREYQKRRRLNKRYRIHDLISRQIRLAIGERKAGRSWELLVGYSLSDLIGHIERQFVDSMSWINHGAKWHIDHIRPVSSFDFSSKCDDAIRECWSLSNLRPLGVFDNLSKGAKWLPPQT